jgi:glycosyltransferase involved in cell wall biosynthesis
VFAVSEDLGARLEAVAGPLGDRVHIVSAGVDTDAFTDGDAAVAASALGWDSDGPRVVCVANYIERKNLPRLIEAFARARTAWGGGSLALVGDGPQQAALEALAGELGIAGSVRFVLHAPPAEVPRWLRACDVACLVSTVEGFGLAPIEALACGRPVVVSREVPSGAAVTEGRTGAVCDARDVAGMADALQRAATLTPGEEARAAAAPYAVAREVERVAHVLAACIKGP